MLADSSEILLKEWLKCTSRWFYISFSHNRLILLIDIESLMSHLLLYNNFQMAYEMVPSNYLKDLGVKLVE